MPTYRSINIALHSQFGIETIPEYHSPLSPFPSHPALSPIVDDTTATCSVYVPALPGSQFWISYSVSPPVPEGHYFLFKLYIDGENVVSWSTGKGDAWMGKTMFALFKAGNGKTVEKRVMCFSPPDREGRVKEGEVEIRVLRASGRKRVEREMGCAKGGSGINLVNAGRAGPEQPKRFYKFALIDPVDEPFAKVRYHYRSWDQLRELGLLDKYYAESEVNDMSIIEPNSGSPNGDGSTDSARPGSNISNGQGNILNGDGDGISVHDWVGEASTQQLQDVNTCTSASAEGSIDSDTKTLHRQSVSSGTYIPRGAPSEVLTGSLQSLRRRCRLDTYRLSMPHSIKFDAPEPATRPFPLPQKSDLDSPTVYRPHPAYPVEEWTVRTPSPERSFRDGIATPPLERRELGISEARVMSVISSFWKRSVSKTQTTRRAEMDEEVRSVS